jgi:hypothetical protein
MISGAVLYNVEWLSDRWIGKDLEVSGSILTFAWRDEGKPRNSVVMIADFPVEIRTDHPLNRSRRRYRDADPPVAIRPQQPIKIATKHIRTMYMLSVNAYIINSNLISPTVKVHAKKKNNFEICFVVFKPSVYKWKTNLSIHSFTAADICRLSATCRGDYRRGFGFDIGFIDDLQVVTANNHNTIAISTFYSSLEDTVRCSQSVTRCFLVTATTIAIPLPRIKFFLHRLLYRNVNWPCPLLITSRHGPRRKHPSSIVVVQMLHN